MLVDFSACISAVMQELMKESHGITAYLAIHRPQILYMLIECRMDRKDMPVPQPPISFWSNILVRPSPADCVLSECRSKKVRLPDNIHRNMRDADFQCLDDEIYEDLPVFVRQ